MAEQLENGADISSLGNADLKYNMRFSKQILRMELFMKS